MIRSMMRRASGGRWPEVRPGERLSCPEVGRLLQRFLDGELDDGNSIAALADHLEECRRCGLEADTYRAIKAVLADHRPDLEPESVERLREFGERLVEEN